MKKISVIIPYFGTWPNFVQLFNESCRHNNFIDFHFITDITPFENAAANIHFKHCSFLNLKRRIEQMFSISIPNHLPYKLCDFRPAYGQLFKNEIGDSEFWGYCDIDLVFGDLSFFLPKEVFKENDIICFRPDHLHGPFTLYRNTAFVNELFKRSEEHVEIFKTEKYCSFDEFGNQAFHTQKTKAINDFNNSTISTIAIKAHEKNEIRLFMRLYSKEKIFFSEDVLLYKNGHLNNYKTGEEYAFYHWVWEKRAIFFKTPGWKQIPKEYFILSTGFYYRQNFFLIMMIHYFSKTKGIAAWIILKISNFLKRRINLPVKVDTYSTPGLIKRL